MSTEEAKDAHFQNDDAHKQSDEQLQHEFNQTGEPDYAVVKDSENGEPMELPCNMDKTLGMKTLTHAFPGAHGLKFKNPKTGASRALLMDASGQNFVCPAGGWDEKVFTVIYPAKASESADSASGHVSGKGETKRRKVARDEENEYSDDDVAPDWEKSQKRERLSGPQDLIVLGLPYAVTEETVRVHFEQYGTVKMIDLKKGSDGKFKGFGFVLMGSLEDQQKVLDACPHQIGGRRCDVKLPDPGYGSRGMEQLGRGQTQVLTNKIFLGRLTDTLTAEVLRDFFTSEAQKINPNASVNDVYIPKPFRGFGFVTLSHTEVAKEICDVGSTIVDGVSIALSMAMPRQEDFYNTSMYGQGQDPFARSYYNDYGYGRQMMGPGGEWATGYESAPYYSKHKRPMKAGVAGAYGRGGYQGGFVQGDPSTGFYQQGSQNLASGIDALNLNNRQQEGFHWGSFYPAGVPGQQAQAQVPYMRRQKFGRSAEES